MTTPNRSPIRNNTVDAAARGDEMPLTPILSERRVVAILLRLLSGC